MLSSIIAVAWCNRTPGKLFSSGLDLEENASTFREMTSSAGGGKGRDPARKSFEIAQFVTGMQESLGCVDRCDIL